MPEGRHLSPEIIHLIHHVELADAGWRGKLCEQLILATLLSSPTAHTASDLLTLLKSEFGGAVDDSTFDAGLRAMRGRKMVLELADGSLAPSETARIEAEARSRHGQELEARVKLRFVELFTATHLGERAVDEWPRFCVDFLEPLIGELGARTYNLIAGNPAPVDRARTYLQYLRQFEDSHQAGIRRAIDLFFDTTSADTRAFMLQRLYSHLLASAASLDAQTLDSLARARQERIQLRVFVDTNFLFSLLDLHDNPADEAAVELVALLRALSGRVDLRLYVLPITIDEARRTLAGYEAQLGAMPLTSRLGRIALNVEEGLSGIALRYLRAVRESGHRLTAREYFRPYLEDLLPILRGKGIELFNENTDHLTTSQAVIDDIVDQQRFEERRYGRRAKNYELIRHDVALWHLAASKRAGAITSPLEAGYWVVTIDYRLLGFDADKQRRAAAMAPVCVHPAVLVQMLQLWMPRDAALERAMMQGIRSLVPQIFDGEAEEVTIRILRALSRFENVDDLPEDVVESVLMNRALRSRMKSTETIEEQVDFVREAIVEAAAHAHDQLGREVARRKEVEQLLEVRHAALVAQVQARELERGEEAVVRQQLGDQLGHAQELGRRLAERVEALEAGLKSEREANAEATERRKDRIQRVVYVACSVVALGGTLWAVAFIGGATFGVMLWPSGRRALVVLAVGLVMTLAIEAVGRRLPRVRRWPAFRRLRAARKWLFGVAGALLLGLVIDLVKPLLF